MIYPLASLFLVLANSASAAPIALPPGIVLPNYDRTLVGQIESLEAGAYIARTHNPSANWYNPAGLARARGVELATSSSAYDWTSVKAQGGGVESSSKFGTRVPGFLGAAFKAPLLDPDRFQMGLSLSQELSWNTNLQNQFTTTPQTGTTERFTYQVRDHFGSVLPSLAVAYDAKETLRLGAGFALSFLTYQTNDDTSDEVLSAASLSSFSQNSYIDAGTTILRFVAGLQADLSDRWKLGLLARSPGLRLGGTAWFSTETKTSAPGSQSSTSFYDEAATFRHGLPFQADIGVAYVAERFELEVDLRYHAATGPYDVFESDNPQITNAQVGAAAPATTVQTFSPITNEFRDVVNYSIGGRYTLSSSFSLHGGFYTSLSPMRDPTSDVFRKVDLYGVTAGLSIRIDQFSGSFGVSVETGKSDPYDVTNQIFATPVQTEVSVSSLRIFYALAFEF